MDLNMKTCGVIEKNGMFPSGRKMHDAALVIQ